VSPVSSRSDSGVRMIEITVRIEMNRRGTCELTVADDHTRVVFATLADAMRRARSIAGKRPSKLIVHDAYHRLVEHDEFPAGTTRTATPTSGGRHYFETEKDVAP
jgi:hypothetical protein